MCGMCSDYITSCYECSSPGGRQFFLFSDLCIHIEDKYKTKDGGLFYHIEWDHAWEKEFWGKEDPYDCDDHCIENGWYTRDQVVDVVNSFMHWGTP